MRLLAAAFLAPEKKYLSQAIAPDQAVLTLSVKERLDK